MNRLILALIAPLANTGLAILLRSIFPRIDASCALFIAGFATTFAILWMAQRKETNE